MHTSTYHINSNNIALMGHSAGGHLALLYAYMASSGATIIDPDSDTEQNIILSPVQLVISEAGPTEFTVNGQNRPDNFICAMAGISSTESDLPTKLDAVSPSKHVTSSSPYTILAYGYGITPNVPMAYENKYGDDTVPIAPAIELYNSLTGSKKTLDDLDNKSSCFSSPNNDNCVLYYFYEVKHNEFGELGIIKPNNSYVNGYLTIVGEYYYKIKDKLSSSTYS